MSGWGEDGGDAGGDDAGQGGPPPPPPGASSPPPPPPGDPGSYWGARTSVAPVPPPPGAHGGGWGPHRAGIIPFHPMSLGDVLDTAFKLFRATAAVAMLAVAIVYGPLNLLAALPGATIGAADPMDPFAGISAGALGLAGAATLATVLVSPLVTGAVTWIAVQRERGLEVGWQDAYRVAGGRYGRLLGAVLLIMLLTIAGAIAVIVPAVVIGQASTALGVLLGIALMIPLLLAIAVLFYLVVPVILLEDAGAWEAIKRSARLVRPRFWPTVGTVIVAGILIGIIGAVVSFGFGAVSVVAGPAAFVLQAVGSTVGSLLTVPLTANVALLIYLDARIRSEGLDIELLTAELARAR